MYATDITYRDKRSARNQLKQQGNLVNFPIDARPLAARLRLYERMVRLEIPLRCALNTMLDSVISSIGAVTHPDNEIADFLNSNLMAMEDETGQDWRSLLVTSEMVKTWAGFSVSENVYDLKFGNLTLDTMLTYHPIGITLRPNKAGRLIEGQPSHTPGKMSGIYQTTTNLPTDESQLSMWKILYTAREAEFGNYYGRSAIAPCYKWYRLKEAFTDILVATLGKLGERMLWLRMQSYQTNEMRRDPATGRERNLTSLEVVREQFDSAEGTPSLLVLPYQQPEIKPELGSVPMTDQVLGDFILNCIEYATIEMIREFVPYFLIDDKGNNINASQTERRMEVYYTSINRKRMTLSSSFAKKSLYPLVTWNFNRESAKTMPMLSRVYSERAEDWVSTMQMVKGLTDQGYLNPTNSVDWEMVRQMVRVAERALTPEDAQFVREIFVEPKQKVPAGEEGASKSSNSKKPQARKAEGIAANGQGTQGTGRPGRPTGSVTPLFNPR